jgi:hypothetical protein
MNSDGLRLERSRISPSGAGNQYVKAQVRADDGESLELERKMNQQWLVFVAAFLILGGCAIEGPVAPAGLEQKIESARTRSDHQELADIYERQAAVDREAMERHRASARAYERGWVWSGPRGGIVSANTANRHLIVHCENLARLHKLAADENVAMAKEHRQLAADAKD